jgi:hypothetical protein
MENVCCDFDGRVDLWSEFKVLEEEGCSMFVPEELLVIVEVSSAPYLVENKIARHCTRVLSSMSTLMPLTIPPAKQNQRLLLVFIILYQINKAMV